MLRPSLVSKIRSYRSRRASLRPFLTLSSIHMTGNNLITFIKDVDARFNEYLDGVQPDIVGLYRQIIDTVETIGSTTPTKHIPKEFASKIRSLLCHYFRDLNDYHVLGLSGLDNSNLKHGYEKVIDKLTEIQRDMTTAKGGTTL